MERLCTGNTRANRLSALAQAADCLAKAAATLSDAARAAAESFSSDLLDIPAALNLLSQQNFGPGLNINVNGDGDEEHVGSEGTDHYLSDYGEPEPSEVILVQSETNNHRGYSVTPYDEEMSIDQLRFNPNLPPRTVSLTAEPDPAYRIVVEREADVLLFVCALIRQRRKVICYMNCSIPTFHMYKKLINEVAGMNVYTITKITAAEITGVGQKFLQADHSILLLPETTAPSIKVEEIDSLVIHVGWPSDERRYEEQRLIHQARNSILVACSEDEKLYSAGAAIMYRSRPWPGNLNWFRASVALLRPVFDQKLALIPAEMKAKVYPDWLSCHGPRGHRHVKSWDAITLVKRANSFLLEVLRYESPESKNPDSDPQASLPEVSEGFVSHNWLEPAVDEGILRIKLPEEEPSPVPSIAETTWGRPNVAYRESDPPCSLGGYHLGNSSHSNYTHATSQAPCSIEWRSNESQLGTSGRPVASLSSGDSFKTTPGHTYFTIDEEFDAIPLMCFLGTTWAPPTHQKVILFLDIMGCETSYQTLIERVTKRRVFVPTNAKDLQTAEAIASHFVKFRESAILLLPLGGSSPPSALHDVLVDCCVYWGSTLGGLVPILQAKEHRAWLDCQSTSLIMTTAQASRKVLKLAKSHFSMHPNSTDLHYLNDSPWLSKSRSLTRSILSDDSAIVKGLYEGHLYCLGEIWGSIGAREIANRINKFTARVLLTGEEEDGSTKYPCVAGRLVTPLFIINKFKLQVAVDLGLLYVW